MQSIMISHNQIKEIKSLGIKKYRDASSLFVAEGPKVVGELLGHYPCRLLAMDGEAQAAVALAREGRREPKWRLLADKVAAGQPCVSVTSQEMGRMSQLRQPQGVLAVLERPREMTWEATLPQRELCLALDGVQDPGNVGTILRLADWYGIANVLMSPDTADCFAPKVVQASMGALARVTPHILNLPDILQHLGDGVQVYGTFLDGEDIYHSALSAAGIVVMGNEGQGIHHEVERLVTRRLTIPSYPVGRPTSESLNVAVATAVVCSEFRRRMLPISHPIDR